MSYDLCGTADVKASLEITTSTYDTLISTLVSAASTAIPVRYQREFVGPSGGTRTFGVRERLIDLAPHDLRTVTSVVLHPEESPQTLTVNSDYLPLPQGGAPLGGTYQQIRLSQRLSLVSTLSREFGEARLQVIGDWGCYAGTATVPEDIRRAAVITVSSWMDRGIAEYTALVEEGREVRPDRSATWAIPAAAHSILVSWARLGTP